MWKYPVGTVCWVTRSTSMLEEVGTQVTVLSHMTPFCDTPCQCCGTAGRDVEVTPGYRGTCCCSLLPIADPDATAVTETAEELAV